MATDLFDHIAPHASGHFKLYFYSAVMRIMEESAQAFDSFNQMIEQFPFLIGYNNELAQHGLEGLTRDTACSHWRDGLLAWEERAGIHLPLGALAREVGLNYEGVTLLLAVGVIEEEPQFGALFEAMQGGAGARRPTYGLLSAWWSDAIEDEEAGRLIQRFIELGLVKVNNPDAPRAEWVLQIPSLFWDALRGSLSDAPAAWATRYPSATLLPLEELVVSEDLRSTLEAVPGLLSSGEVQAVVVRGPRNNGRRAVLGAVAAALEMDLLVVTSLEDAADERWGVVGPLATLLHAMPAVVVDPAPGETAQLPALKGYSGPVGILIGKEGGVGGAGAEGALTLELKLPNMAERRSHWLAALSPHAAAFASKDTGGIDEISRQFRLTSGNIRRAAELARSLAALEGADAISPAHVLRATRSFNRELLDILATRLESSGEWSRLCAAPEAMSELQSLEIRCRHRETLALSLQNFPGGVNPGVRALFTGPSGTGKSLAARLLASVLQKDIYRLDLSTVVNKYIGETEKNLSRIFSLAEELDIILLVDEGDALLTQRTSVQSSNDRYANLETNYLLQRIESFEGILIVTTNAATRIDSAFQRRFDMIINFNAPEAQERWAIWRTHLPDGHTVDDAALGRIAGYCSLSGGQIRNSVLHASLLALHDGGPLCSAHLQAAIRREYRKMGAVCPLQQ